MMEPGLQHTVCELLLFAFSVFCQHRRSLMLSDKVRFSFFLGGRLFCETVVFVTLFDILVCTLCSGGLPVNDEVFFDVCTKRTGYGGHPCAAGAN